MSLFSRAQSPFRLIGKSDAEIQKKREECLRSLFAGDASEERICFPFEDMLYIVDIGHSDIRSEGMSYGMFIAASLGQYERFVSLWKFSKKFLKNLDGEHAPYFAWQVGILGAKGPFPKLDPGAAPDGEEYFAAALLVAWKKFGKKKFRDEACELLDAMAHKKTVGSVRAMFSPENFLVRFSPVAGNDFTDPSYHTLAFYRLFAKETGDAFWESAYRQSLAFLKRAIHPETGLAPDYAEFDGSPKHTEFFPTSECFSGDAWRVALNLSLDFTWEIPGVCEAVRKDAKRFERESVRKLLRFFESRSSYKADYRTDGSEYPKHPRPVTPGLSAMNAAATVALDLSDPQDMALAKPFLSAFWKTPVPRGKWRYYDGMLYTLGLLALSGTDIQ